MYNLPHQAYWESYMTQLVTDAMEALPWVIGFTVVVIFMVGMLAREVSMMLKSWRRLRNGRMYDAEGHLIFGVSSIRFIVHMVECGNVQYVDSTIDRDDAGSIHKVLSCNITVYDTSERLPTVKVSKADDSKGSYISPVRSHGGYLFVFQDGDKSYTVLVGPLKTTAWSQFMSEMKIS
jgi:hypothetical protein